MIPIVLHHGLFGYDHAGAGPARHCYFRGIDRAISALGHRVIVPRVHPTASIERRAVQLRLALLEQLDDAPPGEVADDQGATRPRAIIIAHSLGGLDARYMLSRLDMQERVAALITICTPHRGSPFADWAVRNLGQRLRGLDLMHRLGMDVNGIVDLTTERCARFNQEIPDAPGVRYFSITAARPWHRVPPFAFHSHKIVFDAEGENDGLVSVRSARWATHLATWPADHWHAINHRLVLEFRNPTGNIAPYYIGILQTLRREGVME